MITREGLSAEDVMYIRGMAEYREHLLRQAAEFTDEKIAERFGVCKFTVAAIRNGELGAEK